LSRVRRATAEGRKSGWSAAFDIAERAYERADYDQALKLLDVASASAPARTGEIELLRARCARFVADYETSYAAATAASRDCDTPAERLAAGVLQALAAKHLRKAAEARRLFTSLAQEVIAAPARDGAEARYLLALAAFEDDDFDRARTLLEPNLRSTDFEAESLALTATIEMAQGRYREAGTLFSRAQRRMNASGKVDARFDAVTVASLATIGAETVDLDLAKRARAAYEKMEWPPSLTAERFAAAGALRTIALLEGDLTSAFFAAREGVSLAPTAALEAVAETQLAAVGRMLGDLGSERLQLRRAWDVLRTMRAETFDPILAYAYTVFATDAPGVLPAEARKAMTAYRSLVAKAEALIDPRLEAFGLVGAARVAESTGDRADAVRHYRHALIAWQRLGIDLRVALAAVDLRRLTGDDAYVKPVRAIVSRAPKAWFAAELKRGRTPISRLTPAERVVLARLLRGESAKAIGEALERSPFTISNHTRKIFAAFELNSRSKVIARCVELGITPEAIEREG
jgi:DNA-binding CsgD family transcriptional regulator